MKSDLIYQRPNPAIALRLQPVRPVGRVAELGSLDGVREP